MEFRPPGAHRDSLLRVARVRVGPDPSRYVAGLQLRSISAALHGCGSQGKLPVAPCKRRAAHSAACMQGMPPGEIENVHKNKAEPISEPVPRRPVWCRAHAQTALTLRSTHETARRCEGRGGEARASAPPDGGERCTDCISVFGVARSPLHRCDIVLL